ncbi:helix-turn-helix transcriptional regulator [Antrihabitans sp. YC2-6]|uniref:ArsR/SmtB family transcription factor n=1 Tax=Antrihabitans sp. YC2-6 TaxID=2799498 RepID=UPI0018F2CEC3|nr:metalloregulator ArsR/SmtB family transcription factor [Antrihabitans sp. YC2-6]MBJ8347746.1 winged helix-turn-helix transcriptional regulator [Antrihabitans sp. YC2-6]
MAIDIFDVVAEPQRRRIIEVLRTGSASVGDLVERLELPQPTVSKHLKVLRDNGFVNSRADAQRRVYSLQQQPFAELDAWLEPYRRLWEFHFDALGRHLESKESQQ